MTHGVRGQMGVMEKEVADAKAEAAVLRELQQPREADGEADAEGGAKVRGCDCWFLRYRFPSNFCWRWMNRDAD